MTHETLLKELADLTQNAHQNQLPIFDIREQNSDLFNIMDEFKFKYRKDTLIIGDVAVSKRCCLENKREDDIRSSLYDNRIHNQAIRMSENYEWHGYILQISNPNRVFQRNFDKKRFNTLIDTLEIRANSHVFHTKNTIETIIRIFTIWRSEIKGPLECNPINVQPRPHENQLWENQMYFLSSMLDIGYKKAEKLLKIFRCPILIIKWIVQAKITGKKTKKVECNPPVKDFGPMFFIKNKQMLLQIQKSESK